jgi:hypothetical protein
MLSGVPKNTYELSLGDICWMESHKDDNPFRFVRGILKRRFEDYSLQFLSHQTIAHACLKIVESNSWCFKESVLNKTFLSKFYSSENVNVKQVVESFRDLFRGYTNSDVILAQKWLDKDKQRILRILSRIKEKNERQILVYGQKQKYNTKERLIRNRDDLNRIDSVVHRIYSNSFRVAQNKLYYLAYRRRLSSDYRFLYPPNDYLELERKILSHDPKKLIFPLRFLKNIPARMYAILEMNWQKGLSREELIISFDDPNSTDNSFFENLDKKASNLFGCLKIDRTLQLQELKDTYSKKLYTASALLAVTLIEGILWDFASYLNHKRIKIFLKKKGKHYPYAWDYTNRKYKIIKDNIPIADKKQLTSARMLLKITRLGSIMPEYLYDYLVDEYYDDRNDLAHGYYREKDMQVEAIAAILCFDMCVHTILLYMNSCKTSVIKNQ